MSKNPQDRNRAGQDEGGEEMENMPKKEKGMDPKKGQQGGQGQKGEQNWNQGQKGEQGGQPHKGDPMNRPKDTDEDADDRKRRPA